MNIFEECLKCRNDFAYFAEKYLKINHPKKGLIEFTLHDYQKRLIETYENNKFVISTKFRQGGFSTTTVLYGLWRCMFFSDQRWLCISKYDREARYLSKMVKDAINWMPETIQPLVGVNRDHEKTFPMTGSEMHFFTPQAAKVKRMTHIFIDEAAFIPKMEQHWQAMWPIIATEGKCFVTSTPNGIGNWFEETYSRAQKKINNFKVFESSYLEHPEYKNPQWVKEIKKNLGEKGFLQEVEACFIGPDTNPMYEKKTKLIKMVCELFEEENEA